MKVDDVNYLARAINKVRTEAGISARRVTASLPTFAVFSSIINIDNPDKKKMAEEVNEEAKKVIPLPLEEMTLDWKVVPETGEKNSAKGSLPVFLTGSPKKLVKKYIDIFHAAKLELASLETETFSLVRALLGDDKSTVMIIEIGANSTDLSIIKDSIPVLNRSLAVCASTVTKALAEKLGLPFAQAEQFKFDLSVSLSDHPAEELPQLLVKTLEPIVTEIQYMLDFFHSQNNGSVDKIILSGGGALLLNLADYLSQRLNIQTIIGDPWHRVRYPEELKPVLSEVGPRLAVAIGLAMREMN
jgi:type IV pilus assembly protein PilM